MCRYWLLVNRLVMLIDSYRSMIVRFASRVIYSLRGERKPLGPGYYSFKATKHFALVCKIFIARCHRNALFSGRLQDVCPQPSSDL